MFHNTYRSNVEVFVPFVKRLKVVLHSNDAKDKFIRDDDHACTGEQPCLLCRHVTKVCDNEYSP